MATINLREAFGASDERIRESMEQERKGLVQYTAPDMADEEKRLHWKYRLPPSVDLSAGALARAAAQRGARESLQVAQATADWEAWREQVDGVVPRQPDELYRATPAEVAKRARDMCDEMERGTLGFFVGGCNGAGKTSTAELALHYWTCDGWSGEKVTEKQYVDAMRACVVGTASRDDVYSRYALPGLLVIDDLGADKPTEWGLAELTELLDNRMQRGLRVIVTSNLTADGLRERWAAADAAAADRLASRLRMLTPLTLPDVDHRARITVRPADEML